MKTLTEIADDHGTTASEVRTLEARLIAGNPDYPVPVNPLTQDIISSRLLPLAAQTIAESVSQMVRFSMGRTTARNLLHALAESS